MAAVPSADPVDFDLPVQPKPPSGAKLFLVRLPNILRFQPKPFDGESFDQDEDEGGEAGGKAANVIRWRETPSGDRQSNARLVKWSDGSMTLHVGNEALTAKEIAMAEGSTHLYAKHKNSALECHGVLRQKLTLAPASRHSKTHQALSKDIAKNHTKTKRIQSYTTVEDPERKKEDDEKAWEESRRLQMRQGQRRARNDEQADAPSLTTDFLDADDDDAELDGNLGALKAQFKKRTKAGMGAAGGRRRSTGGGGSFASGGKRRRSGLYKDRGSDEDNSEDSEEEEEEDDEGEPGEMDDFIVAGSDDEEEAEESDEAEESVDEESDSEEEYGKKKGKGKGKAGTKKKKKKKARLVEDSDDDDD